MKKLKRAFILTALVSPMLAAAADYPWLTFKMTDGSEISVASEGLAINYSDGNLLLKSTTVDQTIPSDQVKSMRFTTSIDAVDEMTDILSSEADYFDLSGIKTGRFSSSDEARNALPSGTYIVRSNKKTIKVIF
ncbi:MAG: hypothetical protein K2H71_11225 [Muribaculaceae bacterium]|nr:hypothetical protein [Muribaculaceae bacterium]